MKTLQNNFTTPEQSKRLLDLGLPAWTANIMFDKNRRRYELIETEDESLAETQRTLFYNGGAIPHWSVGRLIEIELICREPQEGMIPRLSFIYGDSSENGLSSKYLIENLVTYLESGQYKYDFSKLEG